MTAYLLCYQKFWRSLYHFYFVFQILSSFFLLGNVVANLWTWNAMFLIIFFCTVLTEFSESLVRVVVYDDFCCKEPHNSFTAEAKISVAKIKLWNLVKTNNVESIKKVYYYVTSTLAILLFLFHCDYHPFVGVKGWNSFQMTQFLKPTTMNCVGFFYTWYFLMP